MRKVCALSFAAFYLLLTTGMYVCILHCASEYMMEAKVSSLHSETAISHSKDDDHPHKKKPCSKDKDCDCCKQHGEYAITENIQVNGATLFSVVAILPNPIAPSDLFIFNKEAKSIDWPKGHAPPGGSKIPLYISNRTLLI